MCGAFDASELVEPCIETCDRPVTQSTPAEGDLVRPRCGHEILYRAFVERYQSTVYRVAYGILADRQDGDEVAQRVFVKAYFSLASFDGRSSVFVRVYRIVVNECYGFRRTRSKESDSADNLAYTSVPITRDAYPAPDGVVLQRHLLNKVLERIGEEDRYLLLLPRTRRIFCGTTGRGDRHERIHDQGCAVSDATTADPGLRPVVARRRACPSRDLLMSQRIRRLCRRRAIALSAIGIGSWGRAAHALDTVLLKVGDATIEVSFVSGDLDLSRSALLDWIHAAASALTVYYGRFPVSSAMIQVSPADAKAGVMNAVTYGGPARTTITVGQHTSGAQLKDDWTMTHELVHMAFPSVRRRHHWIEEGLATYVEPVARAQAGFLRSEKTGSTWCATCRSTQVTAHIELPARQPQINARTAALYVALADNRDESQVARGENAGRALAHVAVVRSLTQIATIGLDSPFARDVTFSSQPGVGTNGLRLVAFLQDPASGQILGAALQKMQ